MKKTLAILFVCAFLVGCAMPSNNWVYPDTIIKDTKDYKASLTIPCSYVMGTQECTQFIVSLTNKTNSPIKIIWNDTVVVKGSTSDAVTPDGVRFIERDKPKIDTIIPKKLTIDKSFTPNSNIYWSPQLKIWTRYLLTPGDYKVYLALNVNGKDKTQEFDFKIIDNNK